MRIIKFFIYGFIPVLFLLNACTRSNADDTFNNRAIPVKVSLVKPVNGDMPINYSGTIQESEALPLSFKVVGSVTKVHVSEGDIVKKGQLLAEIDNTTYKSTYDISQATLKQAQDAYNRLKPMYEKGNLPEIKFVEVQTGLQQAKATAVISEQNIRDCKLYSPINGIVGKRDIEPGMNALPNLTSITIIQISKVYANISVSESEISKIEKGQTAVVQVGALNKKIFSGKVEKIGVIADPLGHTYKVKVLIENDAQEIKPGMICEVALRNKQEKQAIFIPNEAVLVDEFGKNFVFTVNGEKAYKKYIQLGTLLRDGVEIKSGLMENELIVSSGQQKLVDNASVKVLNN